MDKSNFNWEGPTWEEVKRFCDNTGRNFYELFPYIKRNDKGILVRVSKN